MNYRFVIHKLALLVGLLSAIILLVTLIFIGGVLMVGERTDRVAVAALFITGVGGLAIGGGTMRFVRETSAFLGRREALLLVAASWILGAALAATPYFLWANFHFTADEPHPFKSFIDCYFEAMSGLTTTGATVLKDIESMPRSILLWRALTHWLGGLGIVVLFVAVLPSLGVGGKRLFQIESPGPAPEGLQPHVRETARWLWYIYLALTAAEFLLLWGLTPMDGFDAICHTFATLATGGFSTKNASIGAYYNSPMVDLIVVVFMFMSGVNFGLYYRVCRGNLNALWRDSEFRVYATCLGGGVLIVTAALLLTAGPVRLISGESLTHSLAESLRHAMFTVVSIQTTTGFCTSDSNQWPFITKAVLVLGMFIGGSSGSTAGGIKVVRVWIALKVLVAEIEHAFRPHVVRPVRIGKVAVDPELRLGALAYMMGTVLVFAFGAVLLCFLEQFNPRGPCTFTTAATGCVATLCNVGPGMDAVGAAENYGWFTAPSKVVFSLLMALGRLEMFAIIVLFSGRFWTKN